MKEEIFRYATSVPVNLPHFVEDRKTIQRKLNLLHTGCEVLTDDIDIPQACKDAHWRLNVGKSQLVEVCIYSDGSREIVGIVKEEA